MAAAGPSPKRPRLVHVTTTDMSLDWLLAPQLRAFKAAGYEVIGMSAPGPHVPSLRASGIEHVPLAHATRSFDLASDARALRELLARFRQLRPDIVHTHNPKPGVYGRLAAKLAGVPVIVNTQHGLYATEDDPLARRATVYALERLAAACSDLELIQSIEDRDTLRRLGVPDERLRVIGNGIDLGRFAPPDPTARAEARRALGLGDDAVVVGVVGRLVVEKGYRDVFAAARAVRDAAPDVRILVVGPTDLGKSDAITDAEIERAARDGVEYLGERTEVERLYHAMDLYVLASYREGFPRSAMEAAACGLPIVTTDVRGCRQVVDDGVTGLLVPTHRPDRLAGAIVELARDEERRMAMGKAAAEKARRAFDQRRVIDITLEAYASLLQNRS